MGGYIALYRDLLEKPIWLNSTAEQKTILITILLIVNHEAREWEWKGEKFKVMPGQTITSLESIAKIAGKDISIQNVRSAIVRFEKLEFLTNESTKTGRLITVLNWGLYQGDMRKGNKEPNKEVTKSQQRGNKEVTTNNNDNNDNNDKECNNISSLNSDEYRLASYLFKYIKKNNSNAKEPNLDSWSKEFDKILRIDKRDLEEVKKVIAWCQQDSFWLVNILSPKKLREKYDQLALKMKTEGKPKKNQKPSNWNLQDQREITTDLEQQLRLKAVEGVEEEIYGQSVDEQLKAIRGH